jgi:hypothetical protein
MRKTLLAAVLGLSACGFVASSMSFAADNPIANPLYTTPQQKKYFMEFCKLDFCRLAVRFSIAQSAPAH